MIGDKVGEHLEVRVLPSEIGTGFTVTSRHPGSGDPRLVAIKTTENGDLPYCLAVGKLAPESADVVAFTEGDVRSSAALPMALLGETPNAAVILDALSYPIDEREKVSSALERSIIGIRPDQLVDLIDPRAMKALGAAGDPTNGDLRFYSGDGERPERRRQAAAGFPLLSEMIPATLSLKIAIDRGKPLMDELVKSIDGRTSGTIGKAAIRRLAAVAEAPFGADLETILEFSSRISPDWIPKEGPEWRAFCVAADAIVRKLGASPEETPALLKGCAGRWGDYLSRITVAGLGRPLDDHDPVVELVPSAMRDVRDMIGCFADVVVLPLAAHGHGSSEVVVTPELRQRAEAVARMMLMGDRSAHVVTDLSRRWHSQRAAILDVTRLMAAERRQQLLGDIREGGWPLLTDSVQAPNGLWLVPLGTPNLLAWEGLHGLDPNGVMGLHHCVGGYSSKCIKGDCHIVSVRKVFDDGSYERLSTIEFDRLKPRSDQLSVLQNRSHGNGVPSGPAKDATSWYIEAMAHGHVPIHRERIGAFLEREAESFDGLERFCGFDWRDRDTLNAAVGPWGPFVNSAWSRVGLDDLVQAEAVAWVRETIAPELLGARR